MRIPWTVRRSYQSILKENTPKYSLEGPIKELKLQYFGHLIRRANSLEKTPRLGKYVLVKVFIKEQAEKRATENKMVGGHHRLNGHEFEQILETEKDRAAWHAAVHGVTKSRTRLST